MRFAPPPAMRVSDKGGGLNQTSVRTYNERLVMSLLRQHGSLSRMELGQMSGLSAQTVSVLVRALGRDTLLRFGEAQRGRVGPPSTPMSLNPEGAFAIGIKVGLKSTDIVLIDFVGAVRHHLAQHYAYPRPGGVLAFLEEGIAAMLSFLPTPLSHRLTGVGISLPDAIATWPLPGWDWDRGAQTWSDVDFEARIGAMAGLPAYIQNDATAAAGAEVIFGAARTLGDFAYFFVGADMASRLVLNHHVYAGRSSRSRRGTRAVAALSALEATLASPGVKTASIWQCVEDWPDYGSALDMWITDCAAGLGDAIDQITAFVDIDTVILDGRFPPSVRQRICALLDDGQSAGIKVLPGKVGALAKAVGAASLPFHSRFMVETVGLASSTATPHQPPPANQFG